ncbi:MAG TPA: prevent-host-death protein [Lentisphaeria bacterium]|nr:MAG: prevent-host-death protein [Lentisphaerae bacterium GWF2_49_21]HBC88661.1 prevent-host-death protein [Lentisphaeria bacterium]
MTVYTYSEARQKFSSVLNKANQEGSVRIRRKDGQTFLLKPEKTGKSPLDVPCLNLKLSTADIIDAIKEGRRN